MFTNKLQEIAVHKGQTYFKESIAITEHTDVFTLQLYNVRLSVCLGHNATNLKGSNTQMK